MKFPFDEVWKRLCDELHWSKLKDMWEFLDFSSASISAAKKRGNFPIEWAFKIAQGHGLSTDWVLTGEGPRRLDYSIKADHIVPLVKESEWEDNVICFQFKEHERLKHSDDYMNQMFVHYLEKTEWKTPKEVNQEDIDIFHIWHSVQDNERITRFLQDKISECWVRYNHEKEGLFVPPSAAESQTE